jgi:RHS repeat-associated protein
VQSDFSFDAGGNRAKQLKQRIAANDSRQLEETLYLGSYEREIHMTKTSAAASPVVTKTVHRHNLGGFAVYTKTAKPGLPDAVKLSTILKDHLGSTDLILTSAWNGSTFANPQTERQSFNPWGERRAADTLVTYRATDSDPYRTSAQDYDRGYTGHEQLDDSGLIHMNGRIYDPELGRMLSPDPVVQVPEYSQNFNRYSYVMNNPLNLTDPTGFSWISNVFHKIGSWLKENWKTVVIAVVSIVVAAISGGLASAWAVGMQFGAATSAAIGAGVGTFWGSLTSSLLSGQKLGSSLINALKSGAIAAATMFTLIKGLEMAVQATNPLNESVLYKVDGQTGIPEMVDLTQVSPGALKGKVFVNGIRNDLDYAIRNGALRAGPGKDFYLAHNPTNGGVADLLECGLDKLAGQSPISRSTANVLSKFEASSTTILAHSQGTMIATNALSILAKNQSVAGFKLFSWGAAQNELGAHATLGSHGVKVEQFVNHPLDGVNNGVQLWGHERA